MNNYKCSNIYLYKLTKLSPLHFRFSSINIEHQTKLELCLRYNFSWALIWLTNCANICELCGSLPLQQLSPRATHHAGAQTADWD